MKVSIIVSVCDWLQFGGVASVLNSVIHSFIQKYEATAWLKLIKGVVKDLWTVLDHLGHLASQSALKL